MRTYKFLGVVVDKGSYLGWSDAKEMPIKERDPEPASRVFYHKLRLIIYENLAKEADSVFCGELELDESYFGGIRKGKRRRGASGKIPVFGLLKRGGKVYTQIIADTRSETLRPIIVKKLKTDSIVYTDCYGSYNALDVSELKHYRINHSELFANKHNHINGIENF